MEHNDLSKIIFAQLPTPTFSLADQKVNIPLASAYLITALKSKGYDYLDTEILTPHILDMAGDKALERVILEMRPSVLALTLYLWNSQRSLFLASRLKARIPDLKVIVGGPEVTIDNEWILEHPAIDAGVFGEGEAVIGALLAPVVSGINCHDTFSTFYKEKGILKLNTEPGPKWDLQSAQNPYVSGAIVPGRHGTAFVETMRGCPFKCAYCYYHKTFSGVRLRSRENLNKLWEVLYSKESNVQEIYLMDPTFNARPGFKEILRDLSEWRKHKDIKIHSELRADMLTKEDVSLLAQAGLKSVEIGLQTVNKEALKIAGRQTDLPKTAKAAQNLKDEGVEVTTGIIIGLPKDSIEGVHKTLNWLKENSAYSTVNPFTLSILPGTEFRSRAKELGIEFDKRPPYYVRNSPTWREGDIQRALLECEKELDITMDYSPAPSLVDMGEAVVEDPSDEIWISKWIIDLVENGPDNEIVDLMTQRISNFFTLWFKGEDPAQSQDRMTWITEKLTLQNPHCHIEIVMEFQRPPSLHVLERLLEAGHQPSVYVNKYFSTLYGRDSVVSPSINVILEDGSISNNLNKLINDPGYPARVIWEIRNLDRLEKFSEISPILISPSMPLEQGKARLLMEELARSGSEEPDDVLFRDPYLVDLWREKVDKPCQGILEKIFISRKGL